MDFPPPIVCFDFARETTRAVFLKRLSKSTFAGQFRSLAKLAKPVLAYARFIYTTFSNAKITTLTANFSLEAHMNISERKSGDVTILDVEGKILLGEGDVQLKHKMEELIEGKVTKILLNLANVPYMDSGGLGEIVRSYTTVKKAGGELKLLNATTRIKDLLTITKLVTVFDVHEDEAAGVASFA